MRVRERCDFLMSLRGRCLHLFIQLQDVCVCVCEKGRMCIGDIRKEKEERGDTGNPVWFMYVRKGFISWVKFGRIIMKRIHTWEELL